MRLWQGDSLGHWDGDTLVIDTTNLNGKTWLDEGGEIVSYAEHVVERFTPAGPDTFHYEATVADPIVSVALALLILVGAWRLMRESTDILLEAVPRDVSIAEVHSRMLGVPGVTAVHDLHVWTVTSGMVAMSGHAIVPELATHPEVLEAIRVELARLGIAHVTIQLEVQHECEEPRPVGSAPSGGHQHHPGHTHQG